MKWEWHIRGITNKRRAMLIYLILFIAVIFHSVAGAESTSLKVSILLGDTNSRTAIEALKLIKNEHPELEKISFYIYPSKDIKSRNLTNLKESRLIIIQVMDRQLVEAVKPELEEAIKKGGKVYAVSGAYSEEHKKMGILLDPKIWEYHQNGGSQNLKNMILYALSKDLGVHVTYGDVITFPDFGVYEYKTKKIFQNFDEFKKTIPHTRKADLG